MLDCVREKLLGKLCFADPAAPTFVILISFLAIKIAFLSPLSLSSEDWELCRESCQLSGTDHSISCNSSASHKLCFPACPSVKAERPLSIISSSDLPRCTPGAHRSSNLLLLILPFICRWGTFQPMVHLWYQSVAQLPTGAYTHMHTLTLSRTHRWSSQLPWSPQSPEIHMEPKLSYIFRVSMCCNTQWH